MGRYEQRTWPANPDAPGRKAERQAFRYRAYIPDEIGSSTISIAADVANAVSAAEREVAALNRDPPAVGSLEVLARRLLRAESVASSRIEGLVLSHRRLATAEAEGADSRDETARSVLENVMAMERAIQLGAGVEPLVAHHIIDLHRVLISATNAPRQAGQLRLVQNWIGGNAFNPGRAEFVPPPAKYVKRLLDDLCVFLNRTDLPPVVQAALAHAQFETIHPFADGNGRVGRALIHVVLRRRGLAPLYVPPVSLVLAADARGYIAGLTAFRDGRIDEWCRSFAEAVHRASRKAAELAQRLRELQDQWRTRAGRPRRHSSAEALIQQLPAYPILTVSTAAELLGRSKQAANEAVAALVDAGILKATTLARRNRAWEAVELFDLINEVERELAVPIDTDEPQRPSPARRSR